MTSPLWTWDALLGASGGANDGSPRQAVTGFSIDSRSLKPGDVFVALKDARDGHDFVSAAFDAGASAALVWHEYARKGGDGALIRVKDTLEALGSIGQAARARTKARIVAVTGSVGKTGTKEALCATLAQIGMTHASEKSFNNQWGVPLTLARMPAEAGGTAVIKRESPVFHIMEARAQQATATVRTFGLHPQSSVRCAALAMEDEGSTVTAAFDGHTISYRLAAPGVHLAENSLAVVAVLSALEVDIPRAIGALAHLAAPAGRGARTTLATADGAILIIDESYNANPASMRAALATLAGVPRARFPRRVAVLGDMLELGSHAGELHMGLKRFIDDAGVDLVFACGPNMQALFAALDRTRCGHWAATSEGLEKPLLDAVSSGDVVMIKGSLGSRMAPLAEALRRRYG
jgi:UDP-N-acetylmuramoyl-tripeptide--D-alanyl-D-alanine ligase